MRLYLIANDEGLQVYNTEIRSAAATRAVFHSKLRRNFQKLLRWHCAAKIVSWLHDVLAKFADRKIARIYRVFNFSAVFQKLLHCQHKT